VTPLPIAFHVGDVALAAVVSEGSPLYDTPADHLPALLALAALPLLALVIRMAAPRSRLATRLRDGYRARPPLHRMAAWLLGASAVIHLALIGHHEDLLGALMILDGVLLGVTALLLLLGRRWRPLAGFVLVGSLAGWMLVTVGGRAPDQVGLAAKLIEIAALAVVLTPVSGARIRGAMGSATVVLAVVLTSAAAWAGAFAGGSAGHHAGVTAQPGTLLPVGADREPTDREAAATAVVWYAMALSLARYEDPAAAIAEGYAADSIVGLDTHAPNAAYLEDGRILDPMRPENLIYAESPAGPVLLGAMFEMPPGAGRAPAFGGPLTVWHGHEQVCFSVLGMTGLVSPFGGCPVGSVIIGRTGEMLHGWTAAGTPVLWGELDETWKAAYVAEVAAGRLAAAAGETAAR